MKLKNVFLFITLATLTLGQSAANAAALWSAYLDKNTCLACPTFFLLNCEMKKFVDDYHSFMRSCASDIAGDLINRSFYLEECDHIKKDLDAEYTAHIQQKMWDNERRILAESDQQIYANYPRSKILGNLFAGTSICVIVFISNINAYRAHSALIRDMRFNHDASEELCRTKIGVFKISLERAANFFADNAQRNGATSKDLMPRKLKLKYTPIREILAYADITKENKIAADATFQELQETVQQNKRITINRMFLSGACLGLCVCALIFVFVQ